MTDRRWHIKHTESLNDRLAAFARLMRENAEMLPPGPERAGVLAKANQADATADMDQWMRSSELKRRE